MNNYEENLKKVADFYGLEKQLVQTMEESSELIQVCSKLVRLNRNNKNFEIKDSETMNDLKEEISDVMNMINQLIYLLEINREELANLSEQKMIRQVNRLNLNYEEGCK